MELIDLQCDTFLKEKFNSLKLDEFNVSWSTAKFPNIQKMEQRMLVLFNSTYLCEQTFMVMKTNKAPYRWQLSEHSDFDAQAKKGDQQRCSHQKWI